jgi:hypothetical protein
MATQSGCSLPERKREASLVADEQMTDGSNGTGLFYRLPRQSPCKFQFLGVEPTPAV